MNSRPPYQKHDYVSTKTGEVVFTIHAAVGKTGWARISENGKPLHFLNAAERDAAFEDMME